MKTKTIVTVCNYALEDLTNFESYQEKIRRLVILSKKQNTQLLVFPEYAGMELVAWQPGKLEAQFEKIQAYLPKYIALYQSLAKEFEIYIQSGSLPVAENGFFKNRAYFFDKNGDFDFQDKLILTPVEKNLKILKAGEDIKIFETDFGKVGIAICYDSEFPYLSHDMVKRGAKLIVVPSCTETQHGYTRVSISCRARAIENQCYVANSYLVGQLKNCDFFSDHTGYAGIYSPADLGCPSDGVIAQAKSTEFELVSAELDFEKIDFVRQKGQTTNLKDMQNVGWAKPVF